MNNEFISLGKFIKPHGIKGNIIIESYTNDPKSILNFDKYIYIYQCDNMFKIDFQITGYSKINTLIVEFKQIMLHEIISRLNLSMSNNIRDMINQLRSMIIYTHKNQFSPLKNDNEFYIYQLLRLPVYKINSDDKIGIVKNIYNFSCEEILELELNNKVTQLYPFTEELFPIIKTNSYIYCDTNKLPPYSM